MGSVEGFAKLYRSKINKYHDQYYYVLESGFALSC